MEKMIIINDREYKQCAAPFNRVYASKDGWVVSIWKNGQIGEPTKGRINEHPCPNMRMVEAPCKPYKNKHGKICYSKKINVGQLILLAWVGTPEEAGTDELGNIRKTVDHINHNPIDNHLENLRWASMHENNLNRRFCKRRIDNIERNDFEQFMEA